MPVSPYCRCPLIPICQDFPQARSRLFNEYHVDWTTLTKATVRFDVISNFETVQPSIEKLKLVSIWVKSSKEECCFGLEELPARRNLAMLCLEPLQERVFHQRTVDGLMAFPTLVCSTGGGKQFCRALERIKNRALRDVLAKRRLNPGS